MVARDLPVAVVTGIYANIRHMRIVCHGRSEHGGGVPRGMRRDAAFAVAHLIVRLDAAWQEFERGGDNVVVTCGMIGTNPDDHAISRIPGEVSFSVEIRAERNDTLERFYGRFEAECRAVEAERDVCFEVDRRFVNMAAPMDARWVKHLSGICTRLKLAHELLPSGGGQPRCSFTPGCRLPCFSSETSTARTIRAKPCGWTTLWQRRKCCTRRYAIPCSGWRNRTASGEAYASKARCHVQSACAVSDGD